MIFTEAQLTDIRVSENNKRILQVYIISKPKYSTIIMTNIKNKLILQTIVVYISSFSSFHRTNIRSTQSLKVN